MGGILFGMTISDLETSRLDRKDMVMVSHKASLRGKVLVEVFFKDALVGLSGRPSRLG